MDVDELYNKLKQKEDANATMPTCISSVILIHLDCEIEDGDIL